ncbi:MAG: hypothetical protein AB1649_32825, partial [Chloroflexota bacterium]
MFGNSELRPKNKRPPAVTWRNRWRWLIEPHARLFEPQRSRARLLAAVLLVTIGLSTVVTIYESITWLLGDFSDPPLWIFFANLILQISFFVLNRSGHHLPAARLTT